MKATSIQIGKTYEVKTGRNTTTVKVESFNKKTGGWVCETQGGKDLSVKDVSRFVREIVSKPVKPPRGKKIVAKTECANSDKPLSGVDAAYRVLTEGQRPMKVKEIAEIALASGICKLKGATPEFTISAVLQREIKTKGEDSRFIKTGRGLFAAK